MKFLSCLPRPRVVVMVILGLYLSHVLIYLALGLSGFEYSTSPAWQLVLQYLAMALMLVSGAVLAWNSLLELCSLRWRLAASLTAVPALMLVSLAIVWISFAPLEGLRDPMVFNVALTSFMITMTVGVVLVMLQLLRFLAAGLAFHLDQAWFFRIPGISGVFSVRLDQADDLRRMAPGS